MSFRLDFSPEENYYSFNHNQMTIFKWLHLAFSFWELMQKKPISSTARTIHPSLPHPQRLPGTFESGRRVEVLLHTQVSDLRHISIKR